MAQPAFNPLLIVIPAVGFAIFRRVRTTVGRQPVIRARMIIRMVLFSLLSVIAFASFPSRLGLAGAAAGLTLGVILARVGFMHTRFEAAPGGVYYTPNRWLGLAVVALFFVRLAMRMYQVTGMQGSPAVRPAFTPQQSALTLGPLCLMAGYYVAYYAWVMAKAKTLAPPPPLPPAA